MSQIESFDINFPRCIRVEIEIRIEKNIEIMRFKNKFIDKIKAFFIDDIVFENDMKQNELDVREFFHYNEFNVILLRH